MSDDAYTWNTTSQYVIKKQPPRTPEEEARRIVRQTLAWGPYTYADIETWLQNTGLFRSSEGKLWARDEVEKMRAEFPGRFGPPPEPEPEEMLEYDEVTV